MLKSSILFAIGTFLSRMLGFVRHVIITSFFGASVVLDAFFLAFKIPNLFREMLAEGALNRAFTRVYSEMKSTNEDQANDFFVRFLNFIIWLSFFVCILGVIFSPFLVDVMTLSSGENFLSKPLAIKLTRILFPFLGIMIVGSVFLGVLYQKRSFFVSSVAPMMLNFGYIIGVLYISHWLAERNWNWVAYFGDPMIVGLSMGVLLGALAQVGVYALAIGKLIKRVGTGFFSLKLCQDSKRVFRIMIPASIGASTTAINSTVDTNFATGLGVGTLTWLSSGFLLFQLPIGLFAVGVGSVILPRLSEQIKGKIYKNQKISKEASQTLQLGLELIFWLMVPCWIVIMLLNQEIVQLFFQRGKFLWPDVLATGTILKGYSVGLIAFGLSKILVSFYFAVEQTSYTMKISFFCVAVNLVLNYLLVQTMGYAGIAYSTGGVLIVYVLLLAFGLRRYRINWQIKRLLSSFAVCTVGGLVFFILVSLFEPLGFFIDSEQRKTISLLLELSTAGILMIVVFGLAGLLQFKYLNPKFSIK